jgi:hypothetical protein
MMQNYRRTLTSGLQGFEDLRLSNAVYVDKTQYIPLLRKTGKFIFLLQTPPFRQIAYVEYS